MSKKTSQILLITLVTIGLIALAAVFIQDRSGYQPAPKIGFDEAYISKYESNVTYEAPEVYELANISISLTQVGQESPYRVFKDTDYYQRAMEHFLPYVDHPLLDAINYDDSQIMDYYSFRENSLAYAI